jgi:hypothetical protein
MKTELATARSVLRVPTFRWAVVVSLAIGATASALAQRTMTMIEIAKMDIGEPPPDFDFGRTGQGTPGKWAVVADATANGGRAIEQTSVDVTDYRFPLAIYRPLSAKNLEISLRFKAVAGRVDQAGGIAFRLLDADNYYVLRANALEDNVRFYRVVKGRREQLDGVNIKVAPNQWHTLALTADGERFTVSFNGTQLFTATDLTFAAPGQLALWTKADSVTRFDQIKISTLP